MSDSDWNGLTHNFENILLGEMAALLHDWQKCLSNSVASHWNNNPALEQKATRWKGEGQSEVPGQFADLLAGLRIQTATGELDLKALCEQGRNPASAKECPNPWVSLLGACHDVAHVEKGFKLHEYRGNATDRLSSAFGYEILEPGPLFSRLLSGIRSFLSNSRWLQERRQFQAALRSVWSEAWGDTRRPINEVTLWDWSYAVASLYKSELARHFLTGEWRQPDQLSWRFLRVNFEVLGLYSKAIKVADLLAYQNAVEQVRQRVRQLVEEKYPLGNEVYRDATGIYLTFPDINLPAELAQEIRQAIEAIEPELAPRIRVGHGSGGPAAEELKQLLAKQHKEAIRELTQPFGPENLSTCWHRLWNDAPLSSEVCPVCRLRPMSEGEEACEHCLRRRQSRTEAWKKQPSQTIWLDEIADQNGRVAVIVGKFGLDDWISGDLVQTMLVRAAEDDHNACMPKNPSPARLRRVWETGQRFWSETAVSLLDKLPKRTRWALTVTNLPSDMPEGAVCDGTSQGQPLSLWRQGSHLLTISHVQAPPTGRIDVSWEVNGRKLSRVLQVRKAEEPADKEFLHYAPSLTLLTSPDQFLALAPAGDALEIAARIRCEYVTQFGKVQNRLPFFLGLVFFQRKMPLTAVMDTARRMLRQVSFREESWTVEFSERAGDDKWQLRLRRENQCLDFAIPTRMGDGKTEDVWYPYFFVDNSVDVSSRPYRFKHNGRWLVHVKSLREGDRVCVMPSRFAYVFLEHTAQRLEFDPERHTMLLDELTRLTKMWETLRKCGITDSGLRNVAQLLETKGNFWGRASQEFGHLVESTLTQAGLWRQKEGISITPEDVTSGRLAQCLELYLHVMKARLIEENKGEQQPAAV